MALQSENVVYSIHIGDLGADEDGKARAILAIPAGHYFRVDYVGISADATVAGDNTNNNTIYIQNNSGTATTSVIVSKALTLAVDLATSVTSLGTPVAAYKIVGHATNVTAIYLVEVLATGGLAIPGANIHIRGSWVPK